jgi:nitrogen-specific signal transduction histidine kinase
MQDRADRPDARPDAADAEGQTAASRQAALHWLLSGVMHECRNAMQQISAGAELLAIDLADQPEALNLVRGIDAGLDRMVRLLEDLRLYASPLTSNAGPIDLAQLIQQAWQSLTESGRFKTAQLRQAADSSQSPAGSTACRADAALAGQAILRLLEVMLAASGPNAKIEMQCGGSRISGQPAVAVTLIAPGMHWTTTEKERLFEPFGVRRGRGTGFELAVARRLVELQGGSLRAHSTDGKTSLVLELPG